jgi:uncharacterized SAM-binding protein YcdF (DUF218 family)
MWQEWPLYLMSPFVLALGLWLASLLFAWRGRRGAGLALGTLGFAGLWLASSPLLAAILVGSLESSYPAMAAVETPAADAIVILGGAVSGAQPPARPTIALTASSGRVLHAAALYRAGKAKWIVIAAGNRPNNPHVQPEAEAIADLLRQLGVPAPAIRTEGKSQTTRENAANIRPILEALGARRILLVTSAFHMPRAIRTFSPVYSPPSFHLIAASADVRVLPGDHAGANLWLPSLGALADVTTALKEFAGMAVLVIIP